MPGVFYRQRFGFVGDSYMSGHGLSNPTAERWPARFCALNDADESNVAVGGSGYINPAGGGNLFAQRAALLDPSCTRVFISGGINDAPLASNESTFKAAVVATIDAVRDHAPLADVTVLSPMWWAADPSADVLRVERWTREATDRVRFVENGPWIRYRRAELQQYDGHPNAAGADTIAAWVHANVAGAVTGARMLDVVRADGPDATFGPGVTNLTGNTLLAASPGFYEVEAAVALYGASPGFVFVTFNGQQYAVRDDTTASPRTLRHRVRLYWGGGDLTIGAGYNPSGRTTLISNGGGCRVSARWLHS